MVEVFEGVFLLGLGPLSREASWLGAVISCGPGAALSHESAGELLRLLAKPLCPGVPHVTVPRDGPRRRRGMVVHRSGRFDALERDGITCTTPAQTIVDLAGRLDAAVLEDVVARAARRGQLDEVAVLAILDSGGRPRGAQTLRRVLLERDPRSGPARSRFERAVLALCKAHGIPRPLMNVRLDVGLAEPLEVDFLWPEERVVVEADSFAFHADPSRLREDRRRDVALKLAGFERLRFSWADVTRHQAVTASQIRSLLRRCAPSSGQSG